MSTLKRTGIEAFILGMTLAGLLTTSTPFIVSISVQYPMKASVGVLYICMILIGNRGKVILQKDDDLFTIALTSLFVLVFLRQFDLVIYNRKILMGVVLAQILYIASLMWIVVSLRFISRLRPTSRIQWVRTYRILVGGLIVISFATLPVLMAYNHSSFNNATDLQKIPLKNFDERKEYIDYYYIDLTSLCQKSYLLLSVDERLNLAQQVEYIEAKLAHRNAMRVSMSSLDDGVLGQFLPALNLIVINEDVVKVHPSELLLWVILHESQHATQYSLIQSVNWQHITTQRSQIGRAHV